MGANRAVEETLLYSDLFNFPLKKEEIWFYLVSDKKISRSEFNTALNSFSRYKNYYFVKGKKHIVLDRIKNETYGKEQINHARKEIASLMLFPTIELIGISGSLALGSSSRKDDIDIFVIAKKDKVWISRLCIALSFLLKGVYRKRHDKRPAGKFCLNMIISESYVFPDESRDTYIAHEIAQMLPLFEKNRAYAKFIKSNNWIHEFLPNVSPSKYRKSIKNGLIGKCGLFLIKILFLEQFSKFFQKIYMGPVTREKIGDEILAFHPVDYRGKILNLLKIAKK